MKMTFYAIFSSTYMQIGQAIGQSVDEWVKMTITRFSAKKGNKSSHQGEKKGLTLFICKVDSQECKFSA
jgi:hypothetical protein